MERFVNTDKPLSSLTGIRQVISKGDNDTNIKYQSKTKLEGLNNLLFDRQQTISQIREIEKDIYQNIIVKLKKLLSSKFNLSEQEYLLLIDKFQLKKNELSREKIKDMIIYLNFQKKYDDKSVDIQRTSKSILEQQNRYTNNVRQNNSTFSYQNKIIPPEFEPEIEYLDKQKSKASFEDKLKMMQMERDKLNPQVNTQPNSINNTNQPPHTNFNISNPNINPNTHRNTMNHNTMHNNTMNHSSMNHSTMNRNKAYFSNQRRHNNNETDYRNNMQHNEDVALQYNPNNRINSGEQVNISNYDIDNSRNDGNANAYNTTHNTTHNTYKYRMQSPEYNSNISLDSHSDILKYDIEDDRPKLIVSDHNNDLANNIKNNEQSDINLKIQDSLKQIADNLCRNNVIEEEPIAKETKSMNLMANIISTKSAINSTSENLEFNINYNGKGAIENVVSIELVSCFINHNFYDKNSFSKVPYLLIKIKEFEDILYLNDTNIGGFCQIIWERKPNDCYTYINSDKLFGIYNPVSPIKLDKLTIELFNHRGEPIKIKSTDKDQFNLVFKIKQNI